jgi:hypothetical protein
MLSILETHFVKIIFLTVLSFCNNIISLGILGLLLSLNPNPKTSLKEWYNAILWFVVGMPLVCIGLVRSSTKSHL